MMTELDEYLVERLERFSHLCQKHIHIDCFGLASLVAGATMLCGLCGALSQIHTGFAPVSMIVDSIVMFISYELFFNIIPSRKRDCETAMRFFRPNTKRSVSRSSLLFVSLAFMLALSVIFGLEILFGFALKSESARSDLVWGIIRLEPLAAVYAAFALSSCTPLQAEKKSQRKPA